MKRGFFLSIFFFSFFFLFAPSVKAQCNIEFYPPSPKVGEVVVKGSSLTSGVHYVLVQNGKMSNCCDAPADGNCFWHQISLKENYNEFEIYQANRGSATGCNIDRPQETLRCSRSLMIEPVSCNLTISPSKPTDQDQITITVQNLPPNLAGGLIWLVQQQNSTVKNSCLSGPYSSPTSVPVGQLGNGTYEFSLRYRAQGWNHPGCAASNMILCRGTIVIKPEGGEFEETPAITAPGGISKLCQNNPQCIECFEIKRGVWTGLGCVPIGEPQLFVAWLLKFAIGIGGGIAFLLMLFGAFQIITSAGDPERLKAGKELITSALMGLLLIIFSLFLLRLIGVEILQIPGLQ